MLGASRSIPSAKRGYLFSGLQNCHPITSDPTIEFAISGGLKAPQWYSLGWSEPGERRPRWNPRM